MAVHSMKDVPTRYQEGLGISAVLPRADHRDAFISKKFNRLDDLPMGALVGTASIRRRAQLSALRPDIKYCLLRGNVGTRLSKLEDGVCDATFLACAGLKRLGQADVITQAIEIDVMLNAPAQGAVGIETRGDNHAANMALAQLNHEPTLLAISAERGFLEGLDGSCRTPIAAYAAFENDGLNLRGEILALSGAERFSAQITQQINDADKAREMGLKLAAKIREEVGDFKRLFEEEKPG